LNSSYSPGSAQALFESILSPWWIAGGHAIDLFLGRSTRDHEDLDVAILRRDEEGFRSLLASWDLWPSLGDGRLDQAPLQDGSAVPADREAIWCRPQATSPWAFELLLSRTDGDEWLFKRNPAIRLPLDQLGSATPDGVPFLKPEVVLLFKAKAMRDRDRADFAQVIGALAPEAQRWLRRALVETHSGHPWIEHLER
jgi:Aminoglycoside-2''-adenylyltransferase